MAAWYCACKAELPAQVPITVSLAQSCNNNLTFVAHPACVKVGKAQDSMVSMVNIPSDGRRRFCLNTWQSSAILILAISAFVTIIVYIIRSPWEQDRNGNLICNSGGDIEEIFDGHDLMWDPESYFSINLPVFSDLPFTRAKIIDACWDLGFGRGGQAVVGIAAYRAIRQTIKLTMERCALPILTVTSVCSQQDIRALSVWELIRAAFTRLDSPLSPKRADLHRMRLRILACIFASIYVLSFATIASIMTGYFTVVNGFYGSIENRESLEALASFHRADLLLLDAERVGWRLGATLGVSNRTHSSYSNSSLLLLPTPLLECW